jgi:hypothetical protein
MAASTERLMELLPAVYGLRDAQQRHVLRAFLGVIQEQAEAIESDIDGLYDNWFIETCDEWVVPYIADLLGVRDLLQVTGGGISRRAFVANVLAYRRGKGTAATLEQIARDLTGWPAKSVEFFEKLNWAQHANHVRSEAHATISLTDATELELTGGPFERATHTVEIRHIDNNRARYNLPNVGIFLWRLGSYPIERSPARLQAPGLYRFHQTGSDAPLFNAPVTETALTQTTEEINVPGPVRRRAFNDDLVEFGATHAGVPISDVASNSAYYGPGRSIEVIRGGEPVSPLDIVAADLSGWDRPPGSVLALRSGDLSTFPALSSGAPEVAVTIGDEGPRTATLASVPGSLADAAAALQGALTAASPGDAFTGARVLAVGDRLVVLPGIRGAHVEVAGTPSDATTAGELRLAGPDGDTVHAIVTGDIDPFPDIVAQLPEVEVRIGTTTAVAALASTPTSVAGAASELQAAIRDADSSSAFTDAEVQVAGRRLVVIAGTGEQLAIRPTTNDSTTARQLGLSGFVAVDPHLGRLAFPIGDEPDDDVLVSYNYGFGADIGGGPYDRRASVTAVDPGVWSRTVSQQDPAADFASIADALTAWADPGDGNKGDAVITISDNGAYEEAIAVAPADGKSLVVRAADGVRPRLRLLDGGGELAEMQITGGGDDALLAVDGLLIEGGIRVAPGALGVLQIRHCTLVPGRSIDGTAAASPTRASIVVDEPNDALKLEVVRSITGPVRTPPDMRGLEISDSIVVTPAGPDARALVSGSLATFPSITSTAPRLNVTIGGDGPHETLLQGVPGSLSEARDMLQLALRNAHRTAAFAEARVVSAGNRLVVLSAGGPISIGAAGEDPTAAELRLEEGTGGYESHAFVASPLEPFPSITAAAPKVAVTMGTEGPHDAAFATVPASLAQARDQLQDAIRDAHTSQSFDMCLVAAVDDRLVVIPGALTTVRFDPADDDATTVSELGLLGPGHALSGPSGPGAATTFVASTIFGSAHVRAIPLASESIFSEPVVAQRRQAGCVRFSFVPPGSVVPRRFHCQPQDETTTGRVRPSFASTTYGDPGFGQLTPTCPRAISAGAADEGEMGAFHLVQGTQRLANLSASLDEYLRFGLEAGVFFAT